MQGYVRRIFEAGVVALREGQGEVGVVGDISVEDIVSLVSCS